MPVNILHGAPKPVESWHLSTLIQEYSSTVIKGDLRYVDKFKTYEVQKHQRC